MKLSTVISASLVLALGASSAAVLPASSFHDDDVVARGVDKTPLTVLGSVDSAMQQLKQQKAQLKQQLSPQPSSSSPTSSSSGVQDITSYDSFQRIISGDKPVVVDFWATWCQPCSLMNDQLQQLAQQYGDKIGFYKVDVDEQDQIADEASITMIPTYVFYKGGKETRRQKGANLAALKSAVKQVYNSA